MRIQVGLAQRHRHAGPALAAPRPPLPCPRGFGTAFGCGSLYSAPQPQPHRNGTGNIPKLGPTENRQKRVPAQSVASVDFLSVLSPLFGVSLSAQVVPEHLKMFPRSPTHPQIRPLGPTENRQKRVPAQSVVSVDFLSVLSPLFGVSLSA